ncbi:S-adenosyl-L-methionine-dependent methyltransferase [Ganoderma leucocontextum]|nr:S-adenosyl-L-methionine-dependent methyltransferase [Ganoderma leucocontextum]
MTTEDPTTAVQALAPAELKSIVEAGYDAMARKYLARSVPRSTTTQSIAAHEKWLRVTGVDISAAQVALAREHVQPADGDAERSFDAVLAFYSIFHLPGEGQAPTVGRLRPGGYLLLNMWRESMREDWMDAWMFSSGIGVEVNRRAFAEHGKGLKIQLADEIATEKVHLRRSSIGCSR